MTDIPNRSSLEWRWPEALVDRTTIRAVEDMWGVQFPSDYVECATKFHGGHPNLKCFDFPRHKEAVFSRLLSYSSGDNPTITDVYASIRDRLPDGIYPFAEDPFGNYICFDYRHRTDHYSAPVVVFWNHEIAASTPEQSVSFICDTFTALLSKLYLPDE